MGGAGLGRAALAAENHTWGISGPDFIGFYLVLLVVAAVAVVVIRSWVWRWQAQRPVQRPAGAGDLAPVELAYLTGEADHAIFVACLRLEEQGAIVVPKYAMEGGYRPEQLADIARSSQVRVTGRPTGLLHPLESAVLRQLQVDPAGSVLQATLRQSPEMQALHRDLQASSFLVDTPLARRLRLGAVAIGGVLALGLVRLAAGIMNGRPVLFLVLALMAAGLVFYRAVRVARLTKLGDAAVDNYKRQYMDAVDSYRRQSTDRAGQKTATGKLPSSASRREQGIDAWAVAAFGSAGLWALAPATAAYLGLLPYSTSGGAGSPGVVGCGGTAGGCGGGGCGG